MLDIGDEVEHLIGGMRHGAMRFELRHDRQLSGSAEKIKKAAHFLMRFQLKDGHVGTESIDSSNDMWHKPALETPDESQKFEIELFGAARRQFRPRPSPPAQPPTGDTKNAAPAW
ncbi:hypothetical protein J2W42_002070 [Rhizobium tibeticum]|nr:hypothetical protein [Rhizobium tibeticum]